MKFEDFDGNGTNDNGDVGLPEWIITINGTETATQAVSDSIPTNNTGFYWFIDLPEGEYEVCEIMEEGWIQTFPSNNGTNQCHQVTVVSMLQMRATTLVTLS